jgi:hypothetical protein
MLNLTPQDSLLYVALKNRPGQAYITPDGTQAHILLTDENGTEALLTITPTDANFNEMTDEEADRTILEYIEAVSE